MPGTIASTTPTVLVPGGSLTVSGTGFTTGASVFVFNRGSYSRATVTTPSTTDIVITVPSDLTVGSTGSLLVVNDGETVGARSSDLPVASSASTPTAIAPGNYVRSSNPARPQVIGLGYPVGVVTTSPSGGTVTVSFFGNSGPSVVASVPTSELKILSATEVSYLDGRLLNLSTSSAASNIVLTGRVGTMLTSSRVPGLPSNPVRIPWGYDGGGVALTATLQTGLRVPIVGATVKWMLGGRVVATSVTSGAGAASCTLRASASSPTLLTNVGPGEYLITPVFDGDASNGPAFGQPFSIRIQGVYTAVTLACRDSSQAVVSNGANVSIGAVLTLLVTATPNRVGPSPNNRLLIDVMADNDPLRLLDLGPIGPNFSTRITIRPSDLGVGSGISFSFQGLLKNGPLSSDTNSVEALYVSESVPVPASLVTGATALLTLNATV
jgi:hypothetical protein